MERESLCVTVTVALEIHARAVDLDAKALTSVLDDWANDRSDGRYLYEVEQMHDGTRTMVRESLRALLQGRLRRTEPAEEARLTAARLVEDTWVRPDLSREEGSVVATVLPRIDRVGTPVHDVILSVHLVAHVPAGSPMTWPAVDSYDTVEGLLTHRANDYRDGRFPFATEMVHAGAICLVEGALSTTVDRQLRADKVLVTSDDYAAHQAEVARASAHLAVTLRGGGRRAIGAKSQAPGEGNRS